MNLTKIKVRLGFEKRWPIYMIMDRIVVWEWAQKMENAGGNRNIHSENG